MSVVNFSEHAKRRAEERQKRLSRAANPRPLKTDGGGGTSGGMDPWQQTVETRLGELRQDVRELRRDMDSSFRWTWGGMVASFLILAGMLIAGYFRIEESLQAIADKLP